MKFLVTVVFRNLNEKKYAVPTFPESFMLEVEEIKDFNTALKGKVDAIIDGYAEREIPITSNSISYILLPS